MIIHFFNDLTLTNYDSAPLYRMHRAVRSGRECEGSSGPSSSGCFVRLFFRAGVSCVLAC